MYVTRSEKRLTREQLEAAFPGLVDGLAAIPDVGFVFVATERAGSVAISARGEHYVADERVVGDDPLADYPNALRHLRRTDRFANVPDILCNGRFDPVLGDVPAFEELVGSHGGLGGTQAVPFVLSPVELPFPTGLVVGAASASEAQNRYAAKGISDFIDCSFRWRRRSNVTSRYCRATGGTSNPVRPRPSPIRQVVAW